MAHIHPEVEAAAVGRAFAFSDDHAQAAMLNAFGAELHVICKGNTGTQICALTRGLDKNGKQLIEEIAKFLQLRDETV